MLATVKQSKPPVSVVKVTPTHNAVCRSPILLKSGVRVLSPPSVPLTDQELKRVHVHKLHSPESCPEMWFPSTFNDQAIQRSQPESCPALPYIPPTLKQGPLNSDEFKHLVDFCLSQAPLSQKPQKFAIALSGGIDSFALFHLARETFGKENIIALTVNHRFREESGEEARAVSEECKKWGVKHEILELPWEEQTDAMPELVLASLSPEQRQKFELQQPEINKQGLARLAQKARQLRYNALVERCQHHQIHCLLVAHQLEDDLITCLHRLSRFSGFEGMAAMKPLSRANVVCGDASPVTLVCRPFLSIPKSRLLATLTRSHYCWFQDSSNAHVLYSARNLSIRALARVPLDDAALHPGTWAEFLSHLKVYRRDVREAAREAIVESVVFDSSRGHCSVSLAGPWLYNEAVASRVLQVMSAFITGQERVPRIEHLRGTLHQMRRMRFLLEADYHLMKDVILAYSNTNTLAEKASPILLLESPQLPPASLLTKPLPSSYRKKTTLKGFEMLHQAFPVTSWSGCMMFPLYGNIGRHRMQRVHKRPSDLALPLLNVSNLDTAFKTQLKQQRLKSFAKMNTSIPALGMIRSRMNRQQAGIGQIYVLHWDESVLHDQRWLLRLSRDETLLPTERDTAPSPPFYIHICSLHIDIVKQIMAHWTLQLTHLHQGKIKDTPDKALLHHAMQCIQAAQKIMEEEYTVHLHHWLAVRRVAPENVEQASDGSLRLKDSLHRASTWLIGNEPILAVNREEGWRVDVEHTGMAQIYEKMLLL